MDNAYRPRGMYPLNRSTPSLFRSEPLLGGSPAPAGSLFVLGTDGGFAAAPAAANRLLLGRNSPDVHVTVGAGDGHVSRQHAELHFVDTRWTLRNVGRLPIRIPDTAPLLREHETPLAAGYTALYIRGARLHVVELLVSSGRRRDEAPQAGGPTRDFSWPLTDREKLVLVALFQGFLRRDNDAHPLSWNDTGRELNQVPGQQGWNDRKAENVVDGLRRKLIAAGVAGGIDANNAHPDKIKLNLLRFLTDSATLVPPDLCLLDVGIGAGPAVQARR